jgi:hypothetical protein
MGWLRKSGRLARETDPLAAWGERIGKVLGWFLLWVVGPSTLSGIGLAMLAYLTTYSFLYAATFGFAAFAFVQVALSLLAIRRSVPRGRTSAEPQPGNPNSQPPSTDTDSDQAQELERLREILKSREQRLKQAHEQIERLKREKQALGKEVDKARFAVDKMGKGTTPATSEPVSASSNPTIGETVSLESSGAKITVHGYESPVSPPSWFQNLSPGHELLAIDVEAYAGSNPEDYLNHFQQSDFKLQMLDSTRLRPALAAKEPAFLNYPLAPNDDIRGWITFEVPEGEKPKFVVYSRTRSVIKWAVPQ